jgi:iron complex outermembrane receptor protein
MRRRTLSCLVSAALLPAPQFVFGDGTEKLLEEVTVTARKREESLQDTPIAVSAFTGDALAYRGVSNIGQIAEFTPNLSFQNNPSFGGSSNAAAVFLRGVGQKEFLPTTEPGVGIYVDGVYIARSVGAILDLVDVERVEVLRGPQGTLFGRNTIGGAISLTSKKPHETFSGNIEVKGGSDARRDVKAFVNMPLTDNLYSSVSFASFKQDGYVTREDGVELGDDETLIARGALRWLASDNLTVDFSIDASKDNESGPALTRLGANYGNPVDPNTPPFVVIHNVGANLANGGPAAPCVTPVSTSNPAVPGCYDERYSQGRDYNAGTAETYSRSDLWSTSLVLDWAVSDALQIKSITAYRDLESEFARDGDHSPLKIVHFADTLSQEQFTQELQFLGDALDGELQWIVGLYYFQEEGDNANILDFVVSNFRSGGHYENEATAIYAQATWDVTEKLSATLGLRYTDETKEFMPDQVILNNPFQGSGHPQLDAPFMQAGGRILPFVNKEISITETTPMLNLAYQLNDDVMLYATYSEGFKSGGFTQRVFPPIVAGFTAPAGTPDVDLIPTFDAEFVEVYELGVKYATEDNRLTINAAVFSTQYDDLQVQVFTSVAPVTRNAASASIDGFELEMQWIPGDGWLINAGLGYVDASYDDIDQATTFVAPDSDFERVPEWTGSLALSKEFALSGGSAVIPRLDIAYRSDFFNDTFNTPEIAQDAYTTVNASVSWLSADEAWRVSVGATNLTDEDYLVTGVAGDAFQVYEGLFARGREWYATLNYSF